MRISAYIQIRWFIIEIKNINCKNIAVVKNCETIGDCAAMLDTVISASYENDCRRFAFDKNISNESFFTLGTGLAGEILRKFLNYGIKSAFYGDFTKYRSRPLKDFMYESNKGKDVFLPTPNKRL